MLKLINYTNKSSLKNFLPFFVFFFFIFFKINFLSFNFFFFFFILNILLLFSLFFSQNYLINNHFLSLNFLSFLNLSFLSFYFNFFLSFFSNFFFKTYSKTIFFFSNINLLKYKWYPIIKQYSYYGYFKSNTSQWNFNYSEEFKKIKF